MKTIALIGGLSYESSLVYYKLINELTNKKLGGLNYAKCILYSLNFNDIYLLQEEGDWKGVEKYILDASLKLQDISDFIMICSNTIHRVVPNIEKKIKIPILHIADSLIDRLNEMGIKRIGLIGTRHIMEDDFYTKRLKTYNFEVIIPDEEGIYSIDEIIFKELVVGVIKEESRKRCIDIIDKLIKRGAEAIILGCTELPLLIRERDAKVPLLDSMLIHIEAGVNLAIRE